MTFITPVVEHWLQSDIAQWVHHEGLIWRPITPWAKRSYHWATSLQRVAWCKGTELLHHQRMLSSSGKWSTSDLNHSSAPKHQCSFHTLSKSDAISALCAPSQLKIFKLIRYRWDQPHCSTMISMTNCIHPNNANMASFKFNMLTPANIDNQ